jgi:hypothetical protein
VGAIGVQEIGRASPHCLWWIVRALAEHNGRWPSACQNRRRSTGQTTVKAHPQWHATGRTDFSRSLNREAAASARSLDATSPGRFRSRHFARNFDFSRIVLCFNSEVDFARIDTRCFSNVANCFTSSGARASGVPPVGGSNVEACSVVTNADRPVTLAKPAVAAHQQCKARRKHREDKACRLIRTAQASRSSTSNATAARAATAGTAMPRRRLGPCAPHNSGDEVFVGALINAVYLYETARRTTKATKGTNLLTR